MLRFTVESLNTNSAMEEDFCEGDPFTVYPTYQQLESNKARNVPMCQ